MSKHLQNLQLLQQIGDTNPFKKNLIPALFDIGRDFEADMEAVSANKKWSPEGRRDEAQKLRRNALRDVRDVRKPLDQHLAKTKAMNAEATMPAIDKTDEYAAKLRREARDRSWAMSSGERRALMTGPNRDTDFVDALRECKPWMSGIREPDELQIWEIAEQEIQHHGASRYSPHRGADRPTIGGALRCGYYHRVSQPA
jgi:hypothetical protein